MFLFLRSVYFNNLPIFKWATCFALLSFLSFTYILDINCQMNFYQNPVAFFTELEKNLEIHMEAPKNSEKTK